jgi:malonyl-CoA O-methyltransferase
MTTETLLASLQAYEAWAPSYLPLPHNALMRAEQEAVLALWPEVAGTTALDLACGTGRYARLLQARAAARVVATDLSPAMLAHATADWRVHANMLSLPFAPATFDLIVCGLAVGHASDLGRWMREMARVLTPGGVLVYSDFHPEAARAGMTRSFKDAGGQTHTLIHALHDRPAHRTSAAAAGLTVESEHDVCVGEGLCEAFEGSQAFYRRWQGLPVVLVARVRKPADAAR